MNDEASDNNMIQSRSNRSALSSAATTPLLLEHQESSEEDEIRSKQHNTTTIRWHRRVFSQISSPFVEEKGSGGAVVRGLVTLFVAGTILGVVLPKNPDLPTPWYRVVSSVIGYTYFLCWSVSFYPQVITNFRHKSTVGLSVDFVGMNVLGFACYTAYTACFYWNATIQQLYKQRHNNEDVITVQSNDVAFAIHALVLSCITFAQIVYYNHDDGFRTTQGGGTQQQQRPSKIILYIMSGILMVCLVGAILASSASSLHFDWLDYLYLLSYIKVMISLIKYIPQVVLNFQRKCTSGWSIWNVLLDFTGGVLSDVQLMLDCIDMGDWTGITGNVAKFGLGFVSISFDIIFMHQHYVLYPEQQQDMQPSPPSPNMPLLQQQRDEDDGNDPEITVG